MIEGRELKGKRGTKLEVEAQGSYAQEVPKPFTAVIRVTTDWAPSIFQSKTRLHIVLEAGSQHGKADWNVW